MKKYQEMIQNALLGVVKEVLKQTADNGLEGETHFYITFNTTFKDVVIPEFLKQRYPDEMTIVLQHQFDELKVDDDKFSVLLSFNGRPERLTIPFQAISTFADPSEQFALQFMPSLMNTKEEKEHTEKAEVIDLASMRGKKQ